MVSLKLENRASTGLPGSVRNLCVLLFLLFGASFAFFAQSDTNPNALCRAALVANIVQFGRVDIDGYDKLTPDKALYNGRYYCDKAPGMSFLAAPISFAFTRLFAISAETPHANPDKHVWPTFVYLCALSTSGLISAVAGVALFRYLLNRTGDLGAALVGSLTFGLGTPVFGWATAFFGHATAASLLVIGLITMDCAARAVAAGQPALAPAVLSGLALGGSTAVEYTSLVPAVIIGACYAASAPWQSKATSIFGMFTTVGLGALCALLPVLAYHDLAFGSPFSIGYGQSAFEGHQTGLFGIGTPDPSLIGELIYGGKRGLLWISPVMLAAVWGVVIGVRQSENRIPAFASALVLAWYLVMNSGFTYWLGGWSTGPRYLTPALGVMAVPLGLAWLHFGKWMQRITLVLLAVSISVNLACTAVDMAAPEKLSNPLLEYILPNLVDGQVNATMPFKIAKVTGVHNLVPLVVLWSILGWLIWREAQGMKRSRETAAAALS